MRRCVSVCIVLSVLIAFGLLFQGCSSTGSSKQTAQPDARARVTAAELKIVEETNRVRANPSAYARELQAELNRNRSKMNRAEIAEYEAAIACLNATSARNPLIFDEGLFRAAREHAVDMHTMNKLTHTGSDGSRPSERVARHGSYRGSGENVAGYGNRSLSRCCRTASDDCPIGRWDGGDLATAAFMVKAWVLSTTGHRQNMLNERYTLIGPALVSGHTSRREFFWYSVQKFAFSKN